MKQLALALNHSEEVQKLFLLFGLLTQSRNPIIRAVKENCVGTLYVYTYAHAFTPTCTVTRTLTHTHTNRYTLACHRALRTAAKQRGKKIKEVWRVEGHFYRRRAGEGASLTEKREFLGEQESERETEHKREGGKRERERERERESSTWLSRSLVGILQAVAIEARNVPVAYRGRQQQPFSSLSNFPSIASPCVLQPAVCPLRCCSAGRSHEYNPASRVQNRRPNQVAV